MPSCSREEEVCPSSPEKEKVMAVVTLLPSSVESCEGGHGLCLHLLEKRRSALLVLRGMGAMTIVIFFLSSVESCGGGHCTSSREEKVCPSYS